MFPEGAREAASADGLGPKQRIFHAAMAIALRNGFGKVSLSLVAHEAGLSKGGLLYHFATKNDLIRAMLEFYVDSAPHRVQPFRPGKAISPAPGFDPFAVAVLIAAAENPALLEPFSEILQSVETRTGGSPEPARCSLPLLGNLANRLSLVAERSPSAERSVYGRRPLKIVAADTAGSRQ